MYSIENLIKRGIVPEQMQENISLFNEFFSTSIKYSLIEERELKFFLENKNGRSFFAFSLIEEVDLVKDIPIREKINTNPFFQTFSLNRTSILEQMFENMLIKIENQFLKLKTISKSKDPVVDGFKTFPATKYALLGNPNKDYSFQELFKKAISSSIKTKSIQNFVIIHKFLKENFSFVHGVFFKRNLNDFFGQKKCLLRVKYKYAIPEFEVSHFKNLLNHFNNRFFNKYDFFDKHKSNQELYNLSKFTFSYYVSYIKYTSFNFNVSYLFFAFQRVFLNSSSILRYMYYSLNSKINFKETKRLTCSPEYRTDNVISFRIKNDLAMSNCHPLNFFNIDYKKYSPEQVDLVFRLLNTMNSFPSSDFIKRTFLFVNTFDPNDILKNIDIFYTKFSAFGHYIILGYDIKKISFDDLNHKNAMNKSFLKEKNKDLELETFRFLFICSIKTNLFLISRFDFLRLCVIKKRENLKTNKELEVKDYIKRYRHCI